MCRESKNTALPWFGIYELLNHESSAAIFLFVRPLIHPALDDITLEGILHALSDPVRAAIYATIVESGCPQTCSDFLRVSERNIPKSTLSQHFHALRQAGLIHSERRGVEMHNVSRRAEIERRFPGLIGAIISAHKVQTAGKRKAETRLKKPVAPGRSPRSRRDASVDFHAAASPRTRQGK